MPPRPLAAALAAALVAGLAHSLVSETVTLTTSYPSPAGIYKSLTSTALTVLARDSGNVGIGSTAPQAKLDVTGDIRASREVSLGQMNADPALSASREGSLYYNTTKDEFRGFIGNRWREVAAEPDFDSGWILDQYWPTHVTAIPHGLGMVPSRIQMFISQTNPPTEIYPYPYPWRGQYSTNPWHISMTSTHIRISQWSGDWLYQVWDANTGWKSFSTGYIRAYVWK